MNRAEVERVLRERAARGSEVARRSLAQLTGQLVQQLNEGSEGGRRALEAAARGEVTSIGVDFGGVEPTLSFVNLPDAVVEPPDRFAGMNRTERLYAEKLDADPDVAAWFFEAVTLKLGHDCRLTVDFLVVQSDGRLRLDDVKGSHTWEDALVKMRVAAAMFPMFRFQLARKPKGGAEFTITPIPPR